MNRSEKFPYQDVRLSVDSRAADLLERMTLEEKINQVNAVWLSEISNESESGEIDFSNDKAIQRMGSGIGQITRPGGSTSLLPHQQAKINNEIQDFLLNQTRLGIPAVVHEECLCGFMARKATIFPQMIGLASTWDPDLIEAVGQTIRKQLLAVGARQGLAPVLDISRDQRWGRVEETFGEDPYLTARMGTAYVKGMQGEDIRNGVVATAKHFAAHGIPESGLNWAPVRLGVRELREVYLHPFEAAVKEAGLAGIMNAYHELDGIPCASSKWLLDEILRDEWGFDGIIVSDYNAIVMLAEYHHVAFDKKEAACLALSAGLDLELPQSDCYSSPLLEAVQSGELSMSVLDEAVKHIIRLKFRLGLFENPFVDLDNTNQAFNQPSDRQLSLKAAHESIVLLKNDQNILPISPDTASIAVIGPNADSLRALVGDYTYPAFTELMEGGSDDPVLGGGHSQKPPRFPERYPKEMETILGAITNLVSPKMKIAFAEGCSLQGTSRDGFDNAVGIARNADVAIMVMGGKSGLTQDCTEGELRDRATIGLPGIQEELIHAVIDTNTPVVLVLLGGRPAAIPEIADKKIAIIQAWLPGENGGSAIADVLLGNANPGGKLPITFPKSVGQLPIYYRRTPSAGSSYNFINYVDESVKPLFPFGHGLSYTNFQYSELEINPSKVNFEDGIKISLSVKNMGKVKGDEVIQLYIRDLKSSVTRPVKDLKAFQRISLEPGETKQVGFTLQTAQLAFYDQSMRYVVEPGGFEVMVGSSSEDIRLNGQFVVLGDKPQTVEKVFFSKNSLDTNDLDGNLA